MRFFPVSLAAVALLSASAQAPDRPSPGEVNPDMPLKSDIVQQVNVVIAPTTVTNKAGDFISGLQPIDFELLDNGHAQRITVDVNYRPISMVVVVQANNRTEEILPKIQKMGNVLDSMVIGQEGEAAVVAFDHRIQTIQDFTSDSGKMSDALKKITSGSSSSRMIDATVEAIHMLQHRPPERRKIILLFAERRDVASQGRAREALTAAQFANVTIYTVDISHLVADVTGRAIPPRPDPLPPGAEHLPTGSTATPTEVTQNRDLGNWIPALKEIFDITKKPFVENPAAVMTQFTGGREFSFVSQSALEHALVQLGEELHSQYFISYHPDDLKEGGFHEIRVTVDQPHLDVRTRPGYWTAAQQ